MKILVINYDDPGVFEVKTVADESKITQDDLELVNQGMGDIIKVEQVTRLNVTEFIFRKALVETVENDSEEEELVIQDWEMIG